MRAFIAIVVSSLIAGSACSKGENAGAEEARKAAEAELKEKASKGEVAKKIAPPVPGERTSPASS